MIVKARTFESTNHIKIKITCYQKVMEHACISLGSSITHECFLSQSVNVLLSFKGSHVSDGVIKENA